MDEGIESVENDMKTCSICGKKGQHETRCATVAASSMYSTSNSLSHYIHTDGMTIWESSICTACMPIARLKYLDGRIRSAATTALLGLASLLVATAGFVWLGPTSSGRGPVDFLQEAFWTGQDMLRSLCLAFFFILGAGMVIVGTAMAVSRWVSRARMTDLDVVPDEWIKRCFEGDFKRKLEMRRLDMRKGAKKNGSDATAPSLSAKDFPLPAFKKIEQLSAEDRKQAVAHGGAASDRQWRVIRVYDKTREEFLADPSAEWRKLMPGAPGPD
jgi:hypothetical protein